MKTLTVLLALQTSMAFASNFKVVDPVGGQVRITVPIENLSCEKGPFGMAKLQVKLPRQIGSSAQDGVLTSEYSGDCYAVMANLLKNSNGTHVPLIAVTEARSVVKLVEYGSYNCEGAQQEIVSINLGGMVASESIFTSEGALDCPSGIDPNHVNAIDNVIYVLHENGIPTKSDY